MRIMSVSLTRAYMHRYRHLGAEQGQQEAHIEAADTAQTPMCPHAALPHHLLGVILAICSSSLLFDAQWDKRGAAVAKLAWNVSPIQLQTWLYTTSLQILTSLFLSLHEFLRKK